MISLPYLISLFLIPLSLGLVPINSIHDLAVNRDLLLYVLFGCGATFVAVIISVLDIYPVNTFGTRLAIIRLIDITKDLLKFFNRIIVVVIGSLIVSWVVGTGQLDLRPHEIFLSLYLILGIAYGGSGVLGARVTELLYLLAQVEKEDELRAFAALKGKAAAFILNPPEE